MGRFIKVLDHLKLLLRTNYYTIHLYIKFKSVHCLNDLEHILHVLHSKLNLFMKKFHQLAKLI